MSIFMSFVTRTIDFREAAQVVSLALAYQAMSPDNLISTIGTIALAEFGNHGIHLACKWVKEISLLKQDIQKLIDDDADYQKFLEMEPFLVDGHTNLSTTTFTENSEPNSIVLNKDVLGVIASHLTIEGIARFALVSKSYYSATKADFIWHRKLNEHFPELKCIPREECGFSPEQQVKMVYKRILYPLKQWRSEYEENAEIAKRYKSGSLPDSITLPDGETAPVFDYINRLVGKYYDGTDASLRCGSRQYYVAERIDKLNRDAAYAAEEGVFKSYLLQGKMALDIQARLADFPKRVSDVTEFTAINLCAGIFINSVTKPLYEQPYPTKIFSKRTTYWSGKTHGYLRAILLSQDSVIAYRTERYLKNINMGTRMDETGRSFCGELALYLVGFLS
jgi:hypothetical protein